ncbi:MAG: hypothetical protein K6360_03805 [Deltaproteobacteria bacterium]
MKREDNHLIRRADDLVREMLNLAEEGDAQCVNDGCRVLSAVFRDCAYRCRREIEREKKARIAAGIWEE